MKKILCLMLTFAMLFSFAACGGSTGDSDSAKVTAISFNKESYTIRVDDYVMVSDDMTVEPADAEIVFEISDESIATVSKKGEVYGVKSGEVTLTAKSSDGKVSATCKIVVQGFGTVTERDPETNAGGITNKRKGYTERPDDANAIVIIISKNIDKSVDKTDITTLNYGEVNADGYYCTAGQGYFVAKTNNRGSYSIENVPQGNYVGFIISSMDYTHVKKYDNSTIESTLKESALSTVLSDTEIAAIAATDRIQSREFFVEEFEVKANETTVFCHAFDVD